MKGMRILKVIKKNKFLYTLFFPAIWIRRKLSLRKDRDFNKLFSNVISGIVTVSIGNIPGLYSFDCRSHILKRVLLHKEYEKDVVEIVLQHIDPDRDIINIGANIGLYTNLAASKIADSSKVLAVEPTINAFSLLKKNIQQNGNEKKVHLFNGVASAKPGEFRLNFISGNEEYSSMGSLVHPSIKGKKFETLTVKGETVDHLVSEFHLDPALIIIDVEGAEMSVLQGSIRALKKYRPVIILELIDYLLKPQGHSSETLINFLEDIGYSVFDLNNQKPDFPFCGSVIARPFG